MDLKDKIEVRYITNFPRLKFSAFRNGLLLSSGSNAQDLGETYAKKYKTQWILNDGSRFYSQSLVR